MMSSSSRLVSDLLLTLHVLLFASVFVFQVTKTITATSRFKEDLDLDSLDAVEVVMAIEEEFCIEIPDSEADKILSIADAVQYIASHPMAK